jgi:pimeloyl-ACP methyl ester carboxylesterase
MKIRRLTLPGGRGLCYAEFGASKGIPVVYCHGFPGSRLEAAFADRIASTLGARLIAVDRPGMGMSDYRAERTILGWADDVLSLVDHLELEQFSVLGVSGGAPYALACAFKLPRRIRSTAVVSGVGPPVAVSNASLVSTSGLGLRLTAGAPWLAFLFSIVLGALARHASPLLLTILSAKASELDRRILRDGEFRAILAASMREAFRNGPRGVATDLTLLSRPWNFELRELRVPVHIWHGGKDRVVPMSMGLFLEQALPDCQVTCVPEHGHYSLVHDYAEQILSHLIRRV